MHREFREQRNNRYRDARMTRKIRGRCNRQRVNNDFYETCNNQLRIVSADNNEKVKLYICTLCRTYFNSFFRKETKKVLYWRNAIDSMKHRDGRKISGDWIGWDKRGRTVNRDYHWLIAGKRDRMKYKNDIIYLLFLWVRKKMEEEWSITGRT